MSCLSTYEVNCIAVELADRKRKKEITHREFCDTIDLLAQCKFPPTIDGIDAAIASIRSKVVPFKKESPKKKNGDSIFAWGMFLGNTCYFAVFTQMLTECHSYGEYTGKLLLTILFGFGFLATLMGILIEEEDL